MLGDDPRRPFCPQYPALKNILTLAVHIFIFIHKVEAIDNFKYSFFQFVRNYFRIVVNTIHLNVPSCYEV